MNNNEKLNLFKKTFVNRQDVQCRQFAENDKTSWKCVKKLLSDEDILDHFAGKIRIGLYSSFDSKTKWLATDVDSKVHDEINEVIERFDGLNIPCYLVDSGNKGFHIYVFFGKLIDNKQARALGKLFTTKHEVFPKQDFIPEGSYGNLIGAPLGVHQLTKNKLHFLTNDFEIIPEEDQWDYLASVKTFDIESFAGKIDLGLQKTTEKTPQIFKPFSNLNWKPCILELIKTGSSEGIRNKSGHAIACEARKVDKSESEALGILFAWNLNNIPSLSNDEIELIIRSAFSKRKYEYGCNKTGVLREKIVRCPGINNCEYIRWRT